MIYIVKYNIVNIILKYNIINNIYVFMTKPKLYSTYISLLIVLWDCLSGLFICMAYPESLSTVWPNRSFVEAVLYNSLLEAVLYNSLVEAVL